MKRVFLSLLVLMFAVNIYGQVYNEDNSLMRKALVLYTMDSHGFYHMQENVSMAIVSGIEENYAYDKKGHELYVMTERGNIVITVADNYA